MARPQRRLPHYKAMIVAPQPEAAEAGLITLKAGGNALDAVIACALTQGVVDPLMCGLGGLGSLHIYDPKRGESVVFDGLSTCPAACTPTMWESIFEKECDDGYGFVLKGGLNEIGHTSVTTPGIVRVFGEAHKALGKLPWSALFDPAVSFAEDGWVIRPHVVTMFSLNETHVGRLPFSQKLALTADGRKLYMRADGTPKRLGEAVKNPDLGDTLRLLARHGAESFYTGEIAARIADDMAAHGGLMTHADLKNFKVQQKEPLSIRYRGRTIATPPPPAGGIYVSQILRMLERFDLTSLEHNGADYIALVAEAMKIAGVDKDRFIGDPDFIAPVGCLCRRMCRKDQERREDPARTRRWRCQEHHDRLLHRCGRHGRLADAYQRHALGRDPAGPRLHAERRDELVRSPSRARRLDRTRQAALLLDDADDRVRGSQAGLHRQRTGRRVDRRRDPAGAAQRARLGHAGRGRRRSPALQRHEQCDRHLEPHPTRRAEGA